MADPLTLTIPAAVVGSLKELVREAVHDELAEQLAARDDSFLNVDSAADYLATSPDAIRALVKSRRIPVHRTSAGRLLFARDELRAWVMAG